MVQSLAVAVAKDVEHSSRSSVAPTAPKTAAARIGIEVDEAEYGVHEKAEYGVHE